MRFIVVLLLLAFAALLALLLFAPRYDYDTVIDMPTQSGAANGAFAGVGDPGEEVGMECPVGIEFLTGDELALVDSATRRIVNIDVAARRVTSASAMNLDPTLFPVAAVFEDGRLWLWGQTASGDTQLPVSFTRDGGVWFRQAQFGPQRGDRVLDRFRDLGLSPQQATAGVPAAPPTNAATSPADAYQPAQAFDWSENIPGVNGRGSTARLRIEAGVLKFVVRSADGVERAAELTAPRQMLTAHALGLGPSRESYFTVQNWDPRSAEFDIREEVRRSDLLDVIYDVPLAESDCVAKQHVATSSSGEVYALRVQEKKVSILKLKPRSLFNRMRAWLEAQGLDLPRLNINELMGANAQTVQSNNTIARRDVIANACAYSRETWTATAANLAAPAGTCTCRTGTCVRQYSSPSDMVTAVGQQVRGVPYNWGGADTLAHFRRKVAAGKPGGNVCTNGDKGILRDEVDPTGILPAGVDCSGFVTRALGYSGSGHQFTTSNLATISDPVAKLDMRPGDIANKAGSHVRMLLNWQRPASGAPWDSIEMIESTTAWDGVGRKVYSLAELSGTGSRGGFVMLRPKRIVNTGAPLDANLISCKP